MVYSEEDKHRPLRSPRTGDSLTSSSGLSPESPIMNHLFHSVMFHRVGRWNSVSKIACPASGTAQCSRGPPRKGATKGLWPRTYPVVPGRFFLLEAVA